VPPVAWPARGRSFGSISRSRRHNKSATTHRAPMPSLKASVRPVIADPLASAHGRRTVDGTGAGEPVSAYVIHNFAKVGVEGSNPFARSRFSHSINMIQRRSRSQVGYEFPALSLLFPIRIHLIVRNPPDLPPPGLATHRLNMPPPRSASCSQAATSTAAAQRPSAGCRESGCATGQPHALHHGTTCRSAPSAQGRPPPSASASPSPATRRAAVR